MERGIDVNIKLNKKLIYVIPLILAIVFPLFAGGYVLSIGISVLIAATLGQSWNVMSGYAGQFSFGHATFFGLGAYTSSILFVDFGLSPWIGMICGMLIAAAVGVIIGYLSFHSKIRGDYFALATLAFAEIFRILFNNVKALKGATGILIPFKNDPLDFAFRSDKVYYYIIFGMLLLATLIIYIMLKNKTGLSLIAIRENQEAAGSLGVNVLKYKLIAIAISAAMAAAVGTFYAQYYGFIDPSVVFVATISVQAIVPCIIGGTGTLMGPILGAVIIIPIQEICNSLFTNVGGINMIIYGVFIVVTIIFVPKGIIGIAKRRIKNEE